MDKKRDAVHWLHDQIQDDAEMKDLLHQVRFQTDIAQVIYDARTQAELSQSQLAEKSGISKEIIQSIEEADYDSNLLSTVHKIAETLGLRLDLSLKPESDTVSA